VKKINHLKIFNNHKICIIEQYSNNTVSQVNEQVVVLLIILWIMTV